MMRLHSLICRSFSVVFDTCTETKYGLLAIGRSIAGSQGLHDRVQVPPGIDK
ncbi:MAG: hypothetical protein ACRC62_25920 [Microcoleus sp.]